MTDRVLKSQELAKTLIMGIGPKKKKHMKAKFKSWFFFMCDFSQTVILKRTLEYFRCLTYILHSPFCKLQEFFGFYFVYIRDFSWVIIRFFEYLGDKFFNFRRSYDQNFFKRFFKITKTIDNEFEKKSCNLHIGEWNIKVKQRKYSRVRLSINIWENRR